MGGTAAIAVWAAVTALSRCLMGRHYLGDVVAGILTGVGTAAAVSKVTFICSRLCLHFRAICLCYAVMCFSYRQADAISCCQRRAACYITRPEKLSSYAQGSFIAEGCWISRRQAQLWHQMALQQWHQLGS